MASQDSKPRRAGISTLLEELDRETTENGLPCNIEMERELLMAMLTGDASYSAIAFAVMEPSDFHGPFNAELYAGLKAAWDAGIPFNTPATLIQWLRDSGLGKRLEAMLSVPDGERCMIEDTILVMRSEGLAVNVEYYCITLRRLKMERDIWLTLIDAVHDARRIKPAEWLVKYRDRIASMVPPEM